jgi:hypothetical protein
MENSHHPEKTHALLIGVGKRPDDSEAMAITADDAQKMTDELQKRCGLLPANIHLLQNQEANKANFIASLDALIQKTKDSPAAMVWLYFSGHGCVTQDKKYYLICNDTLKEDIANTALLGTDLVQKLQAMQTDKMLILLDCCHAGGITTQGLQMTDVPFEAEDFLKSKPNRVVLTASHAEQVSFVSKPVSLFTYALIEGLAGKYFQSGDKSVTIFDLAMYIRERVFPLSKLKQQPQLNVLEDSHTGNFTLAHYPDGKPTELPFDTAFKLLDSDGKSLDTETPTEKDVEYRQKYQWLMKNEVNIDGDGNIVTTLNGQNITINNNASDKDLLEILKQQQSQFGDLIQLLKNQQNPVLQQTAERIQQLQQNKADANTATSTSSAIDFKAVEEAYNNSDFVTVLDILGEYHKHSPNPQFAQLRNTLEYYLNNGQMPPPASAQGLKVYINNLKRKLGV